MVKLANRIEALKMQEDDSEDSDMPVDATLAADQTRHFSPSRANTHDSDSGPADSAAPAAAAAAAAAAPAAGEGAEGGGKRTLSKTIKGAIFREVVLAKVREMKEQEQTLKVTEEASKKA